MNVISILKTVFEIPRNRCIKALPIYVPFILLSIVCTSLAILMITGVMPGNLLIGIPLMEFNFVIWFVMGVIHLYRQGKRLKLESKEAEDLKHPVISPFTPGQRKRFREEMKTFKNEKDLVMKDKKV